MNEEPPPAVEIVAAVARFLREDAIPALAGRAAFDARVAANALDLVEREMRLGPAARARANAAIGTLIGDGGAGDLAERLCRRIDAGLADDDVLDPLWGIVLDKLRIDQPTYSRLRQADAPSTSHPED